MGGACLIPCTLETGCAIASSTAAIAYKGYEFKKSRDKNKKENKKENKYKYIGITRRRKSWPAHKVLLPPMKKNRTRSE